MESFLFDTPFGIAIIGGLVATAVGMVISMIGLLQQYRAGRSSLGSEAIQLGAVCLLYCTIMTFVTYGHLVLFTLAGYILPYPIFSRAPGIVLMLWVVVALWIMRHVFADWLPSRFVGRSEY